jgi:phospholipase C
LKTISERFGTLQLTKRDAAAASLGDLLTLKTARTDNVLAGVTPPSSNAFHPNSSVPSKIDMIHAARVAALPVRNQQGFYEEASTASLTSAADVGNFIRDRTAAWKEHKQRQEARRSRQAAASPQPDSKPSHSGGGSHGHETKHHR